MLVLRYRGTGFHGWQRQPNQSTIQGELEKAILELSGESITVSGCGRTDAGVHAKVYAVNFKTNWSIPTDRIFLALNAKLPQNIRVIKAFDREDDFDSRFSQIKKEYTYRFYNKNVNDPFSADTAYFFKQKMDEKAMHEGAQHFIGTQDFASVKSEGTPVKSTVRTIYYCDVTRENDFIEIKVCADGFLYNMVRAIAGTLLYVGIGRFKPSDIPTILKSADRQKAGPTLPPEGLYMTKLYYDDMTLFEGAEILDGII